MIGLLANQAGSRRILWLILLTSVALRIAVAVYLGDEVPAGTDETSYWTLASRLATGHGYSFSEPWYPFTPAEAPTAHWSFLYTAFVAGVYALFGPHPLAARLLGAALGGLLLPWMAYRLVRRLQPEAPSFALAAALLASLYAYFVLYAARLMTETFYISAVLWSLERALAVEKAMASGQRPGLDLVVGLGVSVGIATLLRQSFLPWVMVLYGWFLWTGARQRQLRRSLTIVGLATAVTMLLILPFTIRNYLVYGDRLLLNSNAGYAMYSAQHPFHGTRFQPFSAAPLPDDLEPRPANEAQWDRELMQRGFQFIIDQPGRYVLLSLSRVSDFFMFWPSRLSSPLNSIGRVASFGLMLPFMLYGLWVTMKDRGRYHLLHAFVFVYSLMHLLTWSMVRYRLPVDAVLIIFAVLGLADLRVRMRAFHPLRELGQVEAKK
jgi:hypothetical protein